MNYRSQEVRVGIFVGVSLLLFVGFLAVITGAKLFEHYKEYYALYKYMGGIQRGSLVRFGGMEVGRIDEVELSEERPGCVQLTLMVRDDVPVKEDSDAYITSIGLMGEFYVEITTGSAEAPELAAGSTLNSRPFMPLAQMAEPLTMVSAATESLMVDVNALFSSENLSMVNQLLSQVNTVLGDNSRDVTQVMSNLNALTVEFRRMAETMNSVLSENASNIDSSIIQFSYVLAETRGLLREVNAAMSGMDTMVGSYQDELGATLESMEIATRHFEQFSKSIKEQPWSLVRKSAPKPREMK